jgi:hypothetical protein
MCGKTLALDRLSKGEAKVGVKEEEEEEEEVPKLLEFTVKENQEGSKAQRRNSSFITGTVAGSNRRKLYAVYKATTC